MSAMIAVDANALTQVLNALNGPDHHIRELQHTRNLGVQLAGFENPINVLCQNVKDAVNQPQQVQSKTTVYTKSEMEAMSLYLKVKGGAMTTNDDPEEGIRFFTSLVDRIREERSVLAIRNSKS